jgi:hypothetical protein
MSFIASLAAVGTSVAGLAGITGLSAGAAALTGAGALAAGGAGLGAGMSAAMGGDPGEGALMGAITAPLMAPLMPAAGAAAPATQAGTQVAANVGTQTAAQTAANVGTQTAANVGTQAIQNVVPQTITNTTNAALAKLPEVGWGQSLVGNAFNVPVTGTAANIGGTALQQGVYGAGIGALGSGLTGQDIGKGAGIGFLGGAVGGAGQSALASQAGTATGALGTAAKFAAENPMITSGLISVPTSMALDSATAPDATPLPTQEQRKSQFTYNGPKYNYSPANYTPNVPEWNVYKPNYYAAGGITDLDTYASQAQNIATGGITQIPNPAEVADPEGYGQESVQMMAGGGISKIADNLVSMSPIASAFGWDSASEIPLIGGLFNKPDALPETATLTPEEKQKLMAMMAAQQGQQAGITAQQPQQMAQGGIADLGGYATGGRPNLLQGPGTGVSDDIPATIAGKQPARLASGEYVIPSRIVSELGQGSTDSGAEMLDKMVQKIQTGRSKTLGSKKEFAKDTKAYKHLPV